MRDVPSHGFVTILIVLGLFLCIPAGVTTADIIHLKAGGQTLEGKIVDEKEDQVCIELAGDTGVRLWYDRSRIDRIERTAPAEDEIPTPTPKPLRRGSFFQVIEEEPEGDEQGSVEAKSHPDEASRSNQGESGTAGTRLSDHIGTIQRVAGKVSIFDTAGNLRDAKPGDPVRPGDVIQTSDGKASILLSTGQDGVGEVWIMEETELKAAPDPDTTFEIYRGRIWSRVQEASEKGNIRLQIKSPNAVAAVRGNSLFAFARTNTGESKVALFEGNAEVRSNRSGGRPLSPLEEAVFDRLGGLQDVSRVNPERRREFDEWDATFSDVVELGYSTGPMAGAIVDTMSEQVKEEGRVYKEMMDQANTAVMINQEGDHLSELAEAMKKFYTDVGYFPPPGKPFHHLKYNMGDRGWKGPYLETGTLLPIQDRWGEDVYYELHFSIRGTPYADLVSGGPNRKYDRGRGDDIQIRIPPPRSPQSQRPQ